MSVNTAMTAIADAIRNKTGGTEKLSLDDMATAVEEVYSAGKKAEYDAFWDDYQQFGKREQYRYAFSGIAWTDETFNPKYDMILVGTLFANSMFTNNTGITRIPVTIDCSKGDGEMYAMFQSCGNLKTIKKFVFGEKNTFYNTFSSCSELETLNAEGIIAASGMNLQWSHKLSHDSLASIINALSATTSGLSITFSKTSVNKAFETADGLNDGSTSAEWLELTATKLNWTISLA